MILLAMARRLMRSRIESVHGAPRNALELPHQQEYHQTEDNFAREHFSLQHNTLGCKFTRVA